MQLESLDMVQKSYNIVVERIAGKKMPIGSLRALI